MLLRQVRQTGMHRRRKDTPCETPCETPFKSALLRLQCDALNQLFVTSILIFTLTWVLLAGKVPGPTTPTAASHTRLLCCCLCAAAREHSQPLAASIRPAGMRRFIARSLT